MYRNVKVRKNVNVDRARKWLKYNIIRAVPGDKSEGFTLMKTRL